MIRAPEAAARLLRLGDDQLGALAAAAVRAELPRTPDVAPAVVERLERDALAYPERFARTPVTPRGARGATRATPSRPRRFRVVAVALCMAIVLATAALLLSTGGVDAEPAGMAGGSVDVRVRLEPVVTGLRDPVFVTGAGDGSGRLFVVEQPGTIRVVRPAGALEEEPFLDIGERVAYGGEQGLLGLAFHPDHAVNGRLFVDYTRQPDGATVVSELVVRDGRADPASERPLLVIAQPFENHNGGMIAFDTLGYLLVGMGDGGSGGDPQGHAQDRGSPLGKLLRIDVDTAEAGKAYGIPAGNGFHDDPAARPEIHAMGLRNPWRFSVDEASGDIFIGDVGQELWEEIDVLPVGHGGLDFGWNEVEGPACFRDGCDLAAHEPPVVFYGHDEGCSVVGGFVYGGSAQPLLEGLYLFGDYCSGTIWAAPSRDLAARLVEPVVVGGLDGALASFGRDDAGEPYVVDHGGRVLRLVAEPAG